MNSDAGSVEDGPVSGESGPSSTPPASDTPASADGRTGSLEGVATCPSVNVWSAGGKEVTAGPSPAIGVTDGCAASPACDAPSPARDESGPGCGSTRSVAGWRPVDVAAGASGESWGLPGTGSREASPSPAGSSVPEVRGPDWEPSAVGSF